MLWAHLPHHFSNGPFLTEACFKMEKFLQDLAWRAKYLAQSASSFFSFLSFRPKFCRVSTHFVYNVLNRMAAHHAGDGEFECPTCRATTLLLTTTRGNFQFVCQQFPARSSARSAGHQRSSEHSDATWKLWQDSL